VHKERPYIELRPRKNILYIVLPVTSSSFSVNYNKTHELQLQLMDPCNTLMDPCSALQVKYGIS